MLAVFEQPDTFPEALLFAALPLLPAARREQALRCRLIGDRKRCVIAYLLLCDVLRHEYGIATPPALATSAHGQPFFPDYPQLYLSISHCKAAVAVAVCREPVGIDVQDLIANPRPALADRIAAPRRADRMTPRELTALWTQKEASAKLHGCGLTVPLSTLPFVGDAIETVWRGNADEPYALSVALKKATHILSF